MGLTEGKDSAFKYILSNSVHRFISNWFSKSFHISKGILNDKINYLYLFQCFLEAKNDDMCSLIGSFFKEFIIDLSNQTLTQSNINVLCLYLLRSSNKQWSELNLSGCNIGDVGCDTINKSLIVGDKTSNISFKVLDFRNNLLTDQSNEALVSFAQSFKVMKFDISDNPLHASILKSLCQCKFLKTLNLGSSEYLHNIEIREFLNLVYSSMLNFVHIKDSKKSRLMLQNCDLNIEPFPPTYLSTYDCFVMKNCTTADLTLKNLVNFLTVQETLEYFYIINNNFTNSSVSSFCSTLMKQHSLQEVVIFEHNITTTIADKLSDILNCQITVYSNTEIKSVNVNPDQVLAILAEKVTITKVNIAKCSEQQNKITHCLKIANIVKELIFTEVNCLLHFARVLNFGNLEILHFDKVDITDEAMNELLNTLCENRSLVDFCLVDSHITPTSTKRIIKLLKNVSTIKSFRMCNCGITDEITDDLIVTFENNATTLVNLDVSRNMMETDAVIKIMKALKNSCNLKVFRINNNRITDKAATCIKEVLNNNIYLVEFDATYNLFSPVIGNDLFTALQDKKFLQICNVGHCVITEKSAAKVATMVSKNTDVKALDLSNYHLIDSGAIHIVQALQNIHSLEVFKVSKHLINERTVKDMTSFLSNNSDLVYLDLSFSLLSSGAIKLVRSLQNKPLLKVLKLSSCKVPYTAAEEIANVIKTTSLIELDLSHNSLLAIGIILISRSLKNLKSLQILNLSNCGITTKAAHELTAALLTLHELRELDISLNDHITLNEMLEILVAAFQSTNIHTLKITSCNVNVANTELNRIKASITTKMNCLELSGNYLNVNKLLENITTLRILCIPKCYGIEKGLFRAISQNQNLTKLDISHNRLTLVESLGLAKALHSIKTLRSLIMNNCNITDDVAEDIAIAINCSPFLRELNISWNQLTGSGANKIISSLKRNKYLQILEVASCNIFTGGLCDTLAEPMLQELDISYNTITTNAATILSYLCSCSSIWVLKIANCNITDNDVDIIVPVLSKNYALRHLDICKNRFSSAGYSKLFTSLSALTCIGVLKLTDCSLENVLSSKLASAIKKP